MDEVQVDEGGGDARRKVAPMYVSLSSGNVFVAAFSYGNYAKGNGKCYTYDVERVIRLDHIVRGGKCHVSELSFSHLIRLFVSHLLSAYLHIDSYTKSHHYPSSTSYINTHHTAFPSSPTKLNFFTPPFPPLFFTPTSPHKPQPPHPPWPHQKNHSKKQQPLPSRAPISSPHPPSTRAESWHRTRVS